LFLAVVLLAVVVLLSCCVGVVVVGVIDVDAVVVNLVVIVCKQKYAVVVLYKAQDYYCENARGCGRVLPCGCGRVLWDGRRSR
jgi:hypothetical protein